MKRKALTTTAAIGATLALGVPTAWGSGDFGDHGDATQAKLAAPLVIVRDHGDATQAKLELQQAPLEIVRDHGDATQAKLSVQQFPVEIVRDHGDATQARLEPEPAPLDILRDHGDAVQAKLVAQSTPPLVIVRDHGDATQAKITAQSSPEVFSAETPSLSGREIEWSQLGIGVLIGTVFALGLILAVRFTRSRPLAH